MKTGGTLLMYVLALLSLMACRTSRNTEQQVNRDYSEELCSLSAQMDSLREFKMRVDPRDLLNPGKLVTRKLPVRPFTFSFNRLIILIQQI